MTPSGFSSGDHPELRLRDQMHAIQQTREWKDRYRIRAGIEATNSELKRSHGIGRLRVRRIAKVCLPSMQSYSMQHKEMGHGLYGPEKAVARLYVVFCAFWLFRPD